MGDNDHVMGIEQEVYNLLTKTFILLDDYDRHFFAEYGLSTRQFWALKHLDEEQGCSMVDLSRMLFTDKSNVTGIVDRLEKLKLAVRTPAPTDRRVILITLTPEGRRLRDQVHQEHEERVNTLMSILDKEQLQNLWNYLHTISAYAEKQLSQDNAPLNTSVR